MRTFNPISTHPQRAVQAWQILVGRAKNRQTETYQGLSKLMYGHDASGVLSSILGHICFYCLEHGLPPLNTIVVGKGRGTPGENIPIDPSTIDEERERVYAFDWYDVHPPTADELAEAYQAQRRA